MNLIPIESTKGLLLLTQEEFKNGLKRGKAIKHVEKLKKRSKAARLELPYQKNSQSTVSIAIGELFPSS